MNRIGNVRKGWEADIALVTLRLLHSGMRLVFATGLSISILAGCDRIYGIESRANLSGPVDVGCVSAALSSIPEAGHVTYSRDESRSTEILPRQRKVLTVMNVWLYGERGASILQINQTPDGWTYLNTRSRMGRPVPDDEVARFLPLMRKVNGAIQKRCGLPVGELEAQRI